MITVIIPPREEFNYSIYCDPHNCYLAQKLKIMFTDVHVVDNGKCTINGKKYKPMNNFGYTLLISNFEQKRETIVQLEEQV